MFTDLTLASFFTITILYFAYCFVVGLYLFARCVVMVVHSLGMELADLLTSKHVDKNIITLKEGV